MAHCAGSHLSHDSGLIRSLLFCALRQLALLLLSEVDLRIEQNSLLHKAARVHSGMEMALLCHASSSHRCAVLFSVLGMISVETVGFMCDYTKLEFLEYLDFVQSYYKQLRQHDDVFYSEG